MKDQTLCRADPGSRADSSRRALNRSRNPRCNACGRESRVERRSARSTNPGWKRMPDSAGCSHDTGLPNEDLAHARIETPAHRCLTVENETSFHELAKLRSGELLIC